MREVRVTSGEPSETEVDEVLTTGVVESFEVDASGRVALIVLDTGEAVRFTAAGGALVIELAEVV